MREAECRHSGRLIDRMVAGTGLDSRDRQHSAVCPRCRKIVEEGEWLDDGLQRLAPSLASEPIPSGVLEIPDGADFRPPSWWRTLRVALVGVAVVGVALMTGSQIGSLLDRPGSGVGNVEPTVEAPSETESSPDHESAISCRTPTGPWAPGVEDLETLNGLPRVVVEERAMAVSALYAEPGEGGYIYALCTWFTDQTPPASSGGGGTSPGHPATGPLQLIAAHRGAAADDVLTLYAGAAAPDVARVRIERSDGKAVDAVLQNGYFLAAWPGDAHAMRFVAQGDSGENLASISNNGWDFQGADRP